MSIRYYDDNAEAYARSTVIADMAAVRARFLHHVEPRGSILDAGCGSGRDALVFSNHGYAVTAFDGSAVMAQLASQYTGLPVQHLTFAQLDWKDAFDGLWASASLLHVPRKDLPTVFNRLAAAVRDGGALYVSFKRGDAEREIDGRHFTDVSEDELLSYLVAAGLELRDLWCSDDVRPGRSETWVNAISGKSRLRRGAEGNAHL